MHHLKDLCVPFPLPAPIEIGTLHKVLHKREALTEILSANQ
jgi:hypothetical protein